MQENPALDNFAEVGPQWQAVVQKIKAAVDAEEGITLDAEEVAVLSRALKALAAHIIADLKAKYVPLVRAMGFVHE